MGRIEASARRARLVVAIGLGLAVGCAGDERPPREASPRGDAGFGERCKKGDDCASLLCVRVDPAGGICTDTCRSDAGCPTADNWACLSTEALDDDICACRKLDEVERCGDGVDNDCNGRTDDCRTCDGMEVRNEDPAHCGACNNACRSDQSCTEQRCVCPDDTPDDCGTCVATSRDTNHCGLCGNVCDVGQSCVEGECTCPDETSSSCGNEGCFDLTIDTANCGECGNACPAEQGCVDGECVCPAGETYCEGEGCVDLETDLDHCGECDNQCALELVCGEGECTCPTADAPDFCDDIGCVDFQTDERHCGGCGETCRDDELCEAGECGCPGDGVDCGGVCVDVLTSREHCGACDEPCAVAQACVGGECGCESFGLTVCGTDCANLDSDPAHCGTCGRACGMRETCVEADCECASGLVCDSVCIAEDDPANCGDCGRTCGAGTRCSAGDCVCEQAEQTLCSGACYDLLTDSAHCGSCTNACPSNLSCINGSCSCAEPTVGTAVRATNNAFQDYAYGIAWDGTHVGVAYIQSTATTSYVLRFVLLNPDGTPVSDTLIEGASAVGRMQPDLVWSGTEYGLVWVESLGSRFLRLDANGAAKGTPTGSIGPGGSTKTTLAWSSVYGGYAIGATQGSAGYFRLLGADGSTPAAATTFTRSSGGVGGSIQIAPAPAGGFGLAFGPSRPGLAAFDVNGTLTTPAVSVSTQTMSQMSNIGLVHDGTTWLTTWVDGLENGIRVNRGDQNNGSHIIVSVPSPFRVVSPTVQIANGTLAMAWGKYDGSTSTNSPYTLQMQRFALPSTLTSAPTPLHAVVDMPVTPSSAFNEVGLVYTGSTSMLVVWSDNRWGNSEIYAAPLELGTCP